MTKIKYCDDCSRIVGIGCTCGLSFSEKIKTQNLNWAINSPTRG